MLKFRTVAWARSPGRPAAVAGAAALAAACGLAIGSARAQDPNAPNAVDTAAPKASETVAAADAPPAPWADTIKLHGQIEAGVTFNTNGGQDSVNFGHLFTDKSNRILLNQLLLTAERPLDPKATGVDYAFKLQGMYGSDARYTHFLNELDRNITNINQVDIVEAWGQVHVPVLTDGGLDIKVGQYVTLEGAEVIDASGNFFYSHSYEFNFGVPLKHTGGLAVLHATDMLDLYAGIDTGVNTSIGRGDNNGGAAFHGGFGLNLLDGALTALVTTHIGPENPHTPVSPGFNVNSELRYLNDAVITYKASDALTLITELNYIRDDGFNADGYGLAQYATYAINDWLSVGGRAEIWRDAEGFFVAAFPGNLDFVNAERGYPATVIGGGRTTYGEFTAGVNIKPPVPDLISGFVIRPEVRYDRSFSNTKPFKNSDTKDQVTIAADFVLPF